MGAYQRTDNDRWPEWMKPGVRVVRGPDLAPTMATMSVQELGTLTYVPARVAGNKVCVVWDSGRERYFKSGAAGLYELRAYDLQQVGVVHKGVSCSGCRAKPIRGMRFHCPAPRQDLCTRCYMNDTGDTTTAYIRKDIPSSDGVLLPLRSESLHARPKLKGVFEGATVVPGPHWNNAESRHGNLDHEGVVQSVITEKGGVGNGWVEVKWVRGGWTGEYRLGAGGYVDVVAQEMKKEGTVYLEHLPVVGIIKLKVGDKVCINMALKDFQELQTEVLDEVGWTDSMKQCVQQDGTVLELSADDTLARVQYADASIFLIAQEALYRKGSFYPGCAVTITNDKDALLEIQQGHGQYSPQVCGQLGRVVKIHHDGDMDVIVGDRHYVLSPTACHPVDDPKIAKDAPDMPETDEDDADTGDKIDIFIKKQCPDLDQTAKQMYDAFTVGDIKALLNIIEKNHQLVKYKMGDKTMVHLSSHSGHVDVLKLLLKLGGDAKEADDEGDTPLHYAALGEQSDCAAVLLKAKADPDCKNNNGDTPLMVAVVQPCINTVQTIIQNNANVNIKDDDGSTAMHNAVEQEKGQPVISATVLGAAGADFTICDRTHFNVLHWAVMKNNYKAVEIILNKKLNLATCPKQPERYTPLHMAASNDFIEIVGLLLVQGKAAVDAQDGQQMTPLHLAALQGHKRTVQLLVEKDADVNAADVDGNTPLHLAQLPALNMTISALGSRMADTKIKVTYALVEKGADLTKKNNAGKTPLDLVEDDNTRAMLKLMASTYMKDALTSTRGVRTPVHWSAMSSIQEVKMVVLDSQSQEYADVSMNFMKTMAGHRIQSIQRAQNVLLWEHYCLAKREIEGRLGPGRANELHLFHGTRPDLVPIISKENFDFRLAGDNVGALFGKGSYFADTAKYSDSYARRDDSGSKFMFVAKVLAGRPCHGKQGLKKPPPIDEKDPKKGSYDCTVDNIKKPKIYCVFDKNQYYPEYVVRY